MENQGNTSRIDSGKQWITDQLRSRPAMWAGIAVGLGFAAGLAGRIARRRRRRNDEAFVILEAC